MNRQLERRPRSDSGASVNREGSMKAVLEGKLDGNEGSQAADSLIETVNVLRTVP
jgi:hypothetical protein